ncbi:MAG: tRNA (adenosine(37)-N6)-threonylcarbamoyltransferase complex dimerization subunit type 1 TsaB [Chlorobi bacterium]|nr:tRNA (adenosine(37)-N6)-threonylcarbamoyltransferase complex dimerization subunit type 1 TsaB [Chlorobiota bacterium]
MHLLAIECTHVSLSVAVMNGDQVTLVAGSEWSRAAETVLPLVQQALDCSGTSKEQLDAVAVSSGPGSFTALRIGMSAAKGLAYGLGVPLIPVPTLHALALAALPFTVAPALVSVIPSRRGEYYYARYPRTALEEGAAIDECARGSFGEVLHAAGKAARESVLVARRTADFPSGIEDSAIGFLDADFFSAASLLPEAARLFGSGMSLFPAEVTPAYRQMFVPGSRKE